MMGKIISVLVVIAIVVSCIIYHAHHRKVIYSEKMKWVEAFLENYFTESILEVHMEKDGQYPDSYNPESVFFLSTGYPDLSEDVFRQLEHDYFIDSLNDNQEYLLYIPIVADGKACGYILLSAGIDGKLDNEQKSYPTMQAALDDLKIYKSNEFSYFNDLFGGKDMLIRKMDKCRDKKEYAKNRYIAPEQQAGVEEKDSFVYECKFNTTLNVDTLLKYYTAATSAVVRMPFPIDYQTRTVGLYYLIGETYRGANKKPYFGKLYVGVKNFENWRMDDPEQTLIAMVIYSNNFFEGILNTPGKTIIGD